MGVTRLLIALAALGAGLTAAPAQIRSRVDAVRVDVTVTGPSGTFVTGLTEQDFEVFDNGRRQPLNGFGAGAFPLRVAFVLDCSQSMSEHIEALRAAASVFVSALREGDRAAIGSLTSPGEMRDDRVRLYGDLIKLPGSEESRVWASFEWAASALGFAEGRTAILMASDGEDTDNVLAEFHKSRRAYSVDDAARALEQSGAQLYVVNTGYSSAKKLRQLAIQSGGRVVSLKRSERIVDVWARMLDELRNQYYLSFTPPERDGTLHEINVKVKRRGMTVRAREGYRAPR